MSNYLAIATVTATLAQLLQVSVDADVPGATITTVRPESTGGASPVASVNIFLYHVAPNAQWRNDDLPTRRADGSLSERPRYACDLHYLFSFHGEETRLEPQRLLGSVARTLHAQPVLTRAAIAAAIVNPAYAGFLAASNLANFDEPIRITPTPLSLEELSKVWSIFYQTPYALTLAYQCTVVLIESDDIPREALPVRTRFVAAVPFSDPHVTAVAPALITSGANVTLTGTSLERAGVRVEVAGTSVPATSATNDDLTFTLPQGLAAGVLPLYVVHPIPVDPASKTTIAIRSDAVPLVLRPTVVKPSFAAVSDDGNGTRSATLNLTLDPPVARGQRVVLSLDALGVAPAARGYVFEFPTAALATDTISALAIPCTQVLPGSYLVRVQVDGAESALGVDKTGAYASPSVSLK